MAYSNFTLQTVREVFALEEIDTANLFAGSEPMAPSELLTAVLARNIPFSHCYRDRKGEVGNDSCRCIG